MIETIKQLKEERPDLVELFSKMSKNRLIRQCYLECIDALNMETRVSVFMQECTNNMSKTNYTEDSIRTLISEQKQIEYEDAQEDIKCISCGKNAPVACIECVDKNASILAQETAEGAMESMDRYGR